MILIQHGRCDSTPFTVVVSGDMGISNSDDTMRSMKLFLNQSDFWWHLGDQSCTHGHVGLLVYAHVHASVNASLSWPANVTGVCIRVKKLVMRVFFSFSSLCMLYALRERARVVWIGARQMIILSASTPVSLQRSFSRFGRPCGAIVRRHLEHVYARD